MIRVRQVKVEVTTDNEETRLQAISKKLRIPKEKIKEYSIKKQSLDARDKNHIYYVYEVDILIEKEQEFLKKNRSPDILPSPDETYVFPKSGEYPLNHRPIIVGSGPAGLFCAYLLAENGYHPIIIERGEKVEDRVNTVNLFWETGKLNQESNVQFGEGGAGTFSDGKLNTLVSDENNRGKKVFQTFVECGAKEDILYSYKPHIGTDILRTVIQNIRNKIIEMGGEFFYQTCLTDLVIEDNKIKKVEVNHNKQIPCDILVLAIGHSSRDTFSLLLDKKLKMEAKPFAVGVRVQHPQKMINESQYGKKYKDILGPATYKLTYKAKNGRGVYSFCMCPGGYVVNASSEENRLAINGMSNHNRNSENANSAIIVTIYPRDFGLNPLDGVEYQRKLEEKAYKLGNSKIPVQLLQDFIKNKTSTNFGKINPIFKGTYQFSNLNEILPMEISESLKEAFPYFGKKIKGFDQKDSILAAIESRTSSPVRIVRDEFLESNIKGIYPCGEGAGYAGGIASSGMDGIKIAEAIGKKYQLVNKS